MSDSTNELVIRSLQPEDAADVYAIVTHQAVASQLLQLPGMEFGETLEWAKKHRPGQYRLVAEQNGRVVGSGSITQLQNPRLAHTGHVGLMVHPDYWGQGVGSALMTAYLNLADNWLNLRRVELEVFTDNAVAVHLYKKFGFEVEGTRRAVAFGNGRFLDDHVMARFRRGIPATENHPAEIPPRLVARPPAPVKIRPVQTSDVTDLYRLFNHPLVARTTLQTPGQEIGRTEERVNTRRPGLYRYVAEAEGHVIGMISIHQYEKARLAHGAGLGMMVSPAYWGMGVGSQLMAAILDLADNWLNLKRVDLDVNTDNPAAVRLYQKFGFVIEGTKRLHTYGDGRWADSHFMGRVKE